MSRNIKIDITVEVSDEERTAIRSDIIDYRTLYPRPATETEIRKWLKVAIDYSLLTVLVTRGEGGMS